MLNLAEPMEVTSRPQFVELDPGVFVRSWNIVAIEQHAQSAERCLVYGRDGSVWGAPCSARELAEHLAGEELR